MEPFKWYDLDALADLIAIGLGVSKEEPANRPLCTERSMHFVDNVLEEDIVSSINVNVSSIDFNASINFNTKVENYENDDDYAILSQSQREYKLVHRNSFVGYVHGEHIRLCTFLLKKNGVATEHLRFVRTQTQDLTFELKLKT